MMDHKDSNIGRRGREVSVVDKLELRLGPPSKEGAVEVQRRQQNHQQKQPQQATAFAIPPPPPFGHIRSSSNANYNFVANKINSTSDGVEFQKSYNCSSTQGNIHHQVVSNYGGGSCNKRVAPSSAIGWPPIRSFRKKVMTAAATAASNYKQFSEETSSDDNNKINSTTHEHNNEMDQQGGGHREIKKLDQVMMTTIDNNNKLEVSSDSLYVKIYMEGFPIGRKLNLKAHHNYQSLSSAVDHLFRGILLGPAAAAGNNIESDNHQVRKLDGLLDGNGEYTLVYEDNEGDRVLVGDVPWSMFLSTVKRLRVLKSSELSKVTRSSQPT